MGPGSPPCLQASHTSHYASVWHFAYFGKMSSVPTLESTWSSGAPLRRALRGLGLPPILFPLFHMDGLKETGEVILVMPLPQGCAVP